MAKRFTDTEKWKRPNIRRLTPKMKCALFYLHDNCDFAGIWHVDYELMSFQVGEEVTEREFLDALGDRLLPLPGGKYFVPSFIEFQYGQLNPSVKAQKSVIEILRKHGLINEDLSLITPSKGLGNSLQTVQDKDTATDKETDKEKETPPMPREDSASVMIARACERLELPANFEDRWRKRAPDLEWLSDELLRFETEKDAPGNPHAAKPVVIRLNEFLEAHLKKHLATRAMPAQVTPEQSRATLEAELAKQRAARDREAELAAKAGADPAVIAKARAAVLALGGKILSGRDRAAGERGDDS